MHSSGFNNVHKTSKPNFQINLCRKIPHIPFQINFYIQQKDSANTYQLQTEKFLKVNIFMINSIDICCESQSLIFQSFSQNFLKSFRIRITSFMKSLSIILTFKKKPLIMKSVLKATSFYETKLISCILLI